MKLHILCEMKNSKIAKLIHHPYWNVLFAVSEADEFSRGEMHINRVRWLKTLAKIEEVKNNKAILKNHKSLSFVSGELIMQICKLKPSKMVGQIKEKIDDMIIDGEILESQIKEYIPKVFTQLKEST